MSFFLIKPFLALILISFSCAILGVFVLWKKLAFFGDGLSHSILLGIVIGTVFESQQVVSLIVFALFFCVIIFFLTKNKIFSQDTVIAISTYSCLALAAVVNDIWIKEFNIGSYIFGDILTVENNDILAIFLIFVTGLIYFSLAFRKILLININKDLSRVEGIKANYWESSFLVLLAITIAICIKIVGIFLMSALLILPAAAARIFAKSPLQMVFYSILISIICTCLTSFLVDKYDIVLVPLMIVILSIFFVFGLIVKKIYESVK